ncbi:MAG: glycosyltransferase family 39 protein [Phycisphaeraceae bacterium]|nr:glycosyltransferase family 39 protein [Phycisphaerales bacterium]QOJ19030.1 MAG: glycosyltransferase family 39 protein [Phycisphaeraceae bacterium]
MPGSGWRWLRNNWLIACLWSAAILLSFLSLRTTPMTRTQEARVLVTAREMAADGPRAWLIPHMNGEPRLQKPPLAYWTAASLFKWLPDEPWLARVPFQMAGWMTVVVVMVFTWRLAGRRAGLLAGALLAGMYSFRRHTIFAETDVAVMLFITMAAWSMWEFGRTWAARSQSPRPPSAGRGGLHARCFESGCGWAHLAGLTMGLAVLAKGLQAVMPLLFLVAWALAAGRPAIIWRWCLSGAPVTLLLVAAPWFVYVMQTPEWTTLLHEVDVALEGGSHVRPFWFYGPKLLEASLPWSPVMVLAMAAAVSRCRGDQAARTGLIWLGSVVVPLSIAAQKQNHYALAALPPLGMLGGWVIDLAWRGVDERLRRFTGATLDGALIVLGVIGLLLLGVGLAPSELTREPPESLFPAAITGLLLVTVVTLSWLFSRRDPVRRGSACLAAFAVGMAAILGLWVPSRRGTTVEHVASYLRETFPDRPTVQLGVLDPILIFLYGDVLPHVTAPEDVIRLMQSHPDLVVVALHDPDEAEPDLPGMIEVHEFIVEDDEFSIMVAGEAATPPEQPGQ